MELANIILNVGGNGDTQVFKEKVTPSEVAVLQLIHGNDAVTDIDVLDEKALNDDGTARTNRQERQRLLEVYGKNNEGTFSSPQIDALFPGIAARLFASFDELELDEMFFRTKPKAKKAAAPAADADAKPVSKQNKAELIATAKANGIEVDEEAKVGEIRDAVEAGLAEKAGEPVEGEDEGDMPDAGMFQ